MEIMKFIHKALRNKNSNICDTIDELTPPNHKKI